MFAANTVFINILHAQDSSVPFGNKLAVRLNPKITSALWKSRISVPKETPQQIREKEQLARLIRRINAIKIAEPAKQSVHKNTNSTVKTGALSDNKTVLVQKSNTSTPVADDPNTEKITVSAVNTSEPNILTLLKSLADKSDKVDKPFKLAELLRKSGYEKEAVPYYKTALAQQKNDTSKSARRSAWILLQMGLCLRNTHPAQAKDMFARLLKEHPDSTWAESAKTWLRLTDWYAAEKPMELIRSCMSEHADKHK